MEQSGDVDKDVDITPTLGVGETLTTVAPKVLNRCCSKSSCYRFRSYTTTLNDSDTDGTIDSITVDLTNIGKGTIDIIGTDSIGNKLKYD